MPLLQTRGYMFFQACSGKRGAGGDRCVVPQLAALLSLQIEIKQQPLEFLNKKLILLPPHKAGGSSVVPLKLAVPLFVFY